MGATLGETLFLGGCGAVIGFATFGTTGGIGGALVGMLLAEFFSSGGGPSCPRCGSNKIKDLGTKGQCAECGYEEYK